MKNCNNNSALDDIDLIMMGYARTIKKFSPRRQTMVKYKLSQIIWEAELAQQTENDQCNQDTSAPLTSERASSSATFSGSSLLSPNETEPYLQPVPEATSPAVWSVKGLYNKNAIEF